MKAMAVVLVLAYLLFSAGGAPAGAGANGSWERAGKFVLDSAPVIGGHLVVGLRSEPRTLNPTRASDISSREVIGQTTADLIHINRDTQLSEPSLVTSWIMSGDGRHYTLELRRDVRFSDGVPFDADDVIFSFTVYLDEKVDAPQRDSLLVGKTPIKVTKISPYTVGISLANRYASAERLFDGISILPRHLLEAAYKEGRLAHAWSLGTSPKLMAGLGPYRFKEYVPGQRLVLERNPYYWRVDRDGNHMPYLSELVFLFVANEESAVLRFEAGDLDVIDRLSAEDYRTLQEQQTPYHFHLYDLGPSLDYNFLLFNLNSALPDKAARVRRKQEWFTDVRFRQALSSAIDREAMNQVIYRGRGTPIWTHVTPGNRLWFGSSAAHPTHSLSRAKELLKGAGFSWTGDGGALVDRTGERVEFSVIVSTSGNERISMATMIQEDLSALGIAVQIVQLEFHSMLTRVLETHDYETAIMGLGGGDGDPNSQMNVWLSSGGDHLWNPDQVRPATSWEAEIDGLMQMQMSSASTERRKQLYDRVQEIEIEQVPVVFLVSPHLLVGAKDSLRNLRPVIIDSHILWNSERLFIRDGTKADK
jgi:peptide/nickel transport system substrate-binding protein